MFTFTPAMDYDGDDAFLISVTDGTRDQAATVTVTVTPVDDAPVAHADAFLDAFDQPLQITQASLVANDTDVDSTGLTVESVTAIAHGTVVLDSTMVTFVPDRGFIGTATFGYAVSDGMLDGSTTVDVTVTDDAPPIALGDTAATLEDSAVAIDVLANDSDADGDALAIAAVSTPHHGTATFTATQITYTPGPDYNGDDSFTYVVGDGRGGSATASVGVAIAPVNDAPVAVADSIATPEDTPLAIAAATLLANDADVDGDSLAITAVGAAQRGMVSLSGATIAYTPPVGGTGTDSFAYTVSDGHGGTATATVTVAIAAVAHAPIAVADTATTTEDTPLAIAADSLLANDTDPDGDALAVISVAHPSHCTVALAGATIAFAPSADFDGIASFTYTISDGHGGMATASVAVAVTPVNDPPIANDDTATAREDTPLVLDAVALLGNDTDVDHDALTITSTDGTTTLDGTTITFTPAAGYTGVASFTYTISDGHGGVASATVTVTIDPVEHAPVASDGTATPGAIQLVATDVDGDALTYAIATPPANGNVALAGSVATYTPTAGFTGTDTFTFVANDGFESSSAGTITVTVD
jgi:large repetitive protein